MTYSWSPTAGLGSPNSASTSASPAITTTYVLTKTYTVTGCYRRDTAIVIVDPGPTITPTASSSTICSGNTVTLSATGASTYNWMPGNLSGSSVSTTPASTTTYTVTGTNANGCTGTETITVTVGPPPTVTASSSSSAICTGDNATLSATGATNYLWMPGSLSGSSVVVNPSSTTTYTVTGDNGPGCSSTATVTLTVNAGPTVNITLATDTFCDIDGPTALSGGSPAGGTYSGPGVSGGSFDPSAVGSGTYTITYSYTDGNGCSDSASQSVIVDICSGTAPPDVATSTVLSVSPNPSEGEFMLTFNVASTDDYIIEIHNSLGQIVYAEQLNSFSGQYAKKIDISSYGRGAYTIRLRSSDKEIVERVITF